MKKPPTLADTIREKLDASRLPREDHIRRRVHYGQNRPAALVSGSSSARCPSMIWNLWTAGCSRCTSAEPAFTMPNGDGAAGPNH
jgi:hypothetical protein